MPTSMYTRGAASADAKSTDWYLLHARMLDIFDPEIWRQLLVPATITTEELSNLMIASFGWAGSHMHMWGVREVNDTDGNCEPIKSNLNPEGFAMPMVGFDYRNVARPEDPADWPDSAETGEIDHGLPRDMTFAELETKYNLSGYKHILHYEYDMGDSWEHVVMVEKKLSEAEVLASGVAKSIKAPKGKKRTSAGEEKEKENAKGTMVAKVTAGFGHGVAEDAGSYPGWDSLKEAYKVKGTKKDDEESAEMREWYETMCGNGDPRGLKGKKRLEHFDVKEANTMYEMVFN